MAKQKDQQVAPEPAAAPASAAQDHWQGVTPVAYEDLIQARVTVKDSGGNLYYLEPAPRPGTFTLRVIPK